MAQWGSSGGLISQNISQTVDNQGNAIISSATEFGASPLGYAPLVQSLFGLPNATFQLTPPDTTTTISQANPLPYWDVQDYSAGVMTAQALFDSTTNTWGIKLDPGTAVANDYLTLTTRSFLVNDDNLQLRQQALAVVSKSGTYSGTTQWNLQLLASYYSATDTLLHSCTVATIYDNGTWTSMSGTTTTSGTAISASAHYVDLTFKLNATATVSSSTAVTVKSCLLQTSARNTNSFIVKETFTSSTTWNIPTNVKQLVGAAVLGAGGGGGSGGYASAPSPEVGSGSARVSGGAGGGGGALYIAFNTPISGTALTISVGAGGAGGTVTASSGNFTAGNAGADGGASSVGSLMTAGGGFGGKGGTAYASGTTQVAGTPAGGSAGTASTIIWGSLTQAGAAGGNGASAGTAIFGAAGAGGTSAIGAYSGVPFLSLPGTGAGGQSAVGTTTSGTYAVGSGGAGGGANFIGGGGGGGGGSVFANATVGITTPATSAAGAGNHGGGGGGGGIGAIGETTSGTAGAGGSAAALSGGGGGGGGGAATFDNRPIVPGAGGSGSSGLVVIFYVG
jgi:hypothetical protein